MEASTGELPQIETAGAQKDAPRAADAQGRRPDSCYFLSFKHNESLCDTFSSLFKKKTKKQKLARLHSRKAPSSNFTPLNNMSLEYPLLLSKSKKLGNCPAVFFYYTHTQRKMMCCIMKTACLQGGGHADETFFLSCFSVLDGCCISSHSGIINKLPQCYVEIRVRFG